jgi:class 3 adenylate cyclase
VSLAYHVIGDGPVDLLWLDGARGNIEVMLEHPLVANFFSTLAERCRVIRFDMRGTGLSDRGERPPILEAQVEDARVVLDVVGSQLTTIVGHGWGCAAAALFATTFPSRTSELILAAAQSRNRWAPDYPWGFTEDELERWAVQASAGWGTEGYAALEVALHSPSMVRDRDYVRWVARVQRHWVGPIAAIALERQFYESDVTDVLRAVRVPTLVIARGWDGADEDTHVASLVPQAQLARLPGKDWMMWVGDQASVIAAIWDFTGVERTASAPSTMLQTLMFTDIVGSTEHAAAIGDRAWSQLLDRHHAVIRASLLAHGGREVDTAGDGFFATFDGPAKAILCAMKATDGVKELGIDLRVGIHTGEVEIEDGSFRGIAVHIGARVASLAGSSEILVSRTVRDLVAGSGLTFDDAGEHQLKGVPDTWRLYRVTS